MSDYETLRRTIAEAIRGEPMRDEPTWDLLHDSRKESYLDDADRVLAAIEAAQAKDVLLARAALLAALDPEDEQMLAAVARDMWEYASDGEEYTDLVRVYWEGEARAAVLALKAIAQGEPQP